MSDESNHLENKERKKLNFDNMNDQDSNPLEDIINWAEIGRYNDEKSEIRKLITWIRQSQYNEKDLTFIINRLWGKVILYEPMMELEANEKADEQCAIMTIRLIANDNATPKSIQEMVVGLFLDRIQNEVNLDFCGLRNTIVGYLVQNYAQVGEIIDHWYDDDKIFRVADKIPSGEQNHFPTLYLQLLLTGKTRQSKALAIQALLYNIKLNKYSLDDKEEIITRITSIQTICCASSDEGYPYPYDYSLFYDASQLAENILTETPHKRLQTITVESLIRNDILLVRDSDLNAVDQRLTLISTLRLLTVAKAFQDQFNLKFCTTKFELMLDVLKEENRARIILEACKALVNFIDKLNYQQHPTLFQDLIGEFLALLQGRHRMDVKKTIIQSLQNLGWRFLDLQDTILQRWERNIRTANREIAYELIDAMIYWAKEKIKQQDIVSKLWRIAISSGSSDQQQALQNYIIEELINKSLLRNDHLKYLIECNDNFLFRRKALYELKDKAMFSEKFRIDVSQFFLSLIVTERKDAMIVLLIDAIIEGGNLKDDYAVQQLLNMATQSIAIPKQTRNYIMNNKHWPAHIRWSNILNCSDDAILQRTAVNQLVALNSSMPEEKQYIENLFWDLLMNVNTDHDIKIHIAEGLQQMAQSTIRKLSTSSNKSSNRDSIKDHNGLMEKRLLHLISTYLNHDQLGNTLLPLIKTTFDKATNGSQIFQQSHRQTLDEKANQRLKLLERTLFDKLKDSQL
ncbi:hypothetical protein TrispH2_010830 [Trichoplax sp. H2]|uniref:Uncharacterized protein n=1 Tax=Trichoplax adhaerens TaxID=10228 RepID=B3S2X7_TRIAD|nr:predicted protein [Trichoplax adhaerens]EDV22866.1 predicted protein [Trichoplax adhaerens]RDD37157.1 hypothetical protein TrispH2_010830 [Trichoplax sp. H2]|eukprot:XP_002114732.1 predicted protein [Trichoplax adhaerens]